MLTNDALKLDGQEAGVEGRWILDRRGVPLALFVSNQFNRAGHNFFTPSEMPLQLGISTYSAGRLISPHKHNRWSRSVRDTLEFVLLRKGRATIVVFDNEDREIARLSLITGDMILFVSGGHSWEFLEETQLIEIKQGPYISVEQDKTPIVPVAPGDRR
jgi:hypothetical protein